jgi:ketosteroid isomerase-like protein
MTATFARGDVAGVARFYADDGRLVGPRRTTISGRAAIDRYWSSIRGAKSWQLEVLEVGGTREAAYQVGISTLVTVGPDGRQHASVTEFVVIWKRQADGTFRIALDLYV